MNIALVGNPNCGKSLLFNKLTGLNQAVVNYPGATTEKYVGKIKHQNKKINIIDLPGSFSLYSNSKDEQVVTNYLLGKSNEKIDKVIFLIDVTNIRNSFFYLSQILNLNIPTTLVLNFVNEIKSKEDKEKVKKIREIYNAIEVNPYSYKSIEKIKKIICNNSKDFEVENKIFEKSFFVDEKISYNDLVYNYNKKENKYISKVSKDIINRHQEISKIINNIIPKKPNLLNKITSKIDNILLNPITGFLIFLLILFFTFQLIFATGDIGGFIDESFVYISEYLSENLPKNFIFNFISSALTPAIGAVVVFVPQIATLFIIISILEQSGYMSRIVFMSHKFLSKFGLNGKSIIPLISGAACAIPAIMSSRTIPNKNQRLITMLVSPLMTCSARLPVYTLLVSFVVSSNLYLGVFNVQGIILFSLYILGFMSSLLVSLLFKKILKYSSSESLIDVMPKYRLPNLFSALLYTWNKSKSYLFGAGKIIVIVSIFMWLLLSYGPSGNVVKNSYSEKNRLENSYLGIMGKKIEPLIKPIGYNWEIGIAVLTSFAAREVFVSSMATIYNLDESESESKTFIDKLKNKKDKEGNNVFNISTSLSLLIFYAFALQCTSTLAVLKKETGSWKWPINIFIIYLLIAYIAAFFIFNATNYFISYI